MEFRRKFFLSKIFEKRPILIISTLLHIFSLVCSLIFNNNILESNKFAHAPFNFFWEWLTVFWCVWSSVLTVIYNLVELKWDYEKNEQAPKWWKTFGLILAVGNALSILIFTTYLPDQLSKDIRRGPFWWIYSFIWHYVTFPLSLFYFCKFVKIEEKIVYQKKILLLLAFQPFIFFVINLFRVNTADETYLNTKRGWKKFMVPCFEWAEKGEWFKFFCFFWGGVLALWILLLLLLKIKRSYFPSTLLKGSKKNQFSRNSS
ncbi:hypothetical protein [endosymbiont GvMRE of Glomus versiforme]|uniref:hypothetical protein n=1 Tax=endosymbiont GvMRE of Glomus versiforme TaxID=2039283 RepID=UPI000EE08790|nr:hypothetical protein [endosymbiont GvMRE of Glomus versiforme]RHZ37301.1 hypothetical protein GvMRE_I1g69 [endosymbiont GvMRE of Glomus versiforme]